MVYFITHNSIANKPVLDKNENVICDVKKNKHIFKFITVFLFVSSIWNV